MEQGTVCLGERGRGRRESAFGGWVAAFRHFCREGQVAKWKLLARVSEWGESEWMMSQSTTHTHSHWTYPLTPLSHSLICPSLNSPPPFGFVCVFFSGAFLWHLMNISLTRCLQSVILFGRWRQRQCHKPLPLHLSLTPATAPFPHPTCATASFPSCATVVAKKSRLLPPPASARIQSQLVVMPSQFCHCPSSSHSFHLFFTPHASTATLVVCVLVVVVEI